ncbi:MAG: glycosyltransferase family 4 protein [Acidobacteria bacterium]|nr:glycosyltransferase family 4 protein [Acidobacteriota bacterium]
MKIIYITAGAAGMYCGSCLRDNALAAEMMRQGHQVTLVPIYTPTRTDEKNVSQERVFFGGISVYLEQHSALFRHTPWLVDKLWDAKFALKLAAKNSLPVDPRFLGEMTVSMLKGEDGFQRKEMQKLVHWLKSETAPDLINLPNTLLIGLARPLREALHKPVACTLQGEDFFLEGLRQPYKSEALNLIRANLEYVDAFIAVSDYYAAFMADYLGLPANKIHTVPLGINLEGHRMREANSSAVFTVGYFARVAPEKGLHILAAAYKKMRDRDDAPKARLEAAGYLAPEHQDYLQGIEQQMQAWGLADEFHYRGALDKAGKIEFLHTLDVLSVPTTYVDPKGMFLFEAMANGIPVVQPRHGAFPEIITKTSGGLLVEPGDTDALAASLLAIWKDRARAEELGQNGFYGVRKYYSAERMTARAVEAYASLLKAQQ